MLEAAQIDLGYGVTTVRDSYGALLPLTKVRDRIARGEQIGARILAAGNILGWSGPYSFSFSRVMGQLTLFQEQMNDYIAQGGGEELMAMTPQELRQAIGAYLDKGPDFLKFGGTSHFAEPTFIGFSAEAQQVIVDEAHKREPRRGDALDQRRRAARCRSPPASTASSTPSCSTAARCPTIWSRRSSIAASTARCWRARSPVRPGSGTSRARKKSKGRR